MCEARVSLQLTCYLASGKKKKKGRQRGEGFGEGGEERKEREKEIGERKGERQPDGEREVCVGGRCRGMELLGLQNFLWRGLGWNLSVGYTFSVSGCTVGQEGVEG